MAPATRADHDARYMQGRGARHRGRLGAHHPGTLRSGAYAAYAALRMAGRTMPDFEHWLDTVASFDLAAAKEEPEEGNPTD